jgi:hypothetical protein
MKTETRQSIISASGYFGFRCVSVYTTSRAIIPAVSVEGRTRTGNLRGLYSSMI